MEIVNSIKDYSREVDKMYYEDIDFLGCSEPYCREKIDYLIFKLKTLKGHLKQIDKCLINYMNNSNEKSKCCNSPSFTSRHTVKGTRKLCCNCGKPFEPQSIPLERDEMEVNINKGIELALSAPFPQVAIHHLIDKVIESIMSKDPTPNLTPESVSNVTPQNTEVEEIQSSICDEIYCKTCGGCGEVGCDGIESFLNKHIKGKTDCLYEESYITDIIEFYKQDKINISSYSQKLVSELKVMIVKEIEELKLAYIPDANNITSLVKGSHNMALEDVINIINNIK